MARLTKQQREDVRQMFGGRCAYCGEPLSERWHVDHVEPAMRALVSTKTADGWRLRSGPMMFPERDVQANYMPACPPCNISKATFSLDQWRGAIAKHIESKFVYANLPHGEEVRADSGDWRGSDVLFRARQHRGRNRMSEKLTTMGHQLRRFLDVAAGEGYVFDGIDAADLYIAFFGDGVTPAKIRELESASQPGSGEAVFDSWLADNIPSFQMDHYTASDVAKNAIELAKAAWDFRSNP